MARARVPRSPRRDLLETLLMLALFALAALGIRSFVVTPFSIPSESMLPRLLIGDYLVVAKWPYGYSRWSVPALPLGSGRLWGRLPARGDVVVFRPPGRLRESYIKRVIGLPGDRVALRRGVVMLNGRALPRVRIADFLDPVSPNSPCREHAGFDLQPERLDDGQRVCRYPQYRETLPGGRGYPVLDLGYRADADDLAERVVPAGHLFLMGDNRDRSADSRFPPNEGGVGLVPVENLTGRALSIFWSTDGSGRWGAPGGWARATRWGRIGISF